MSSLPITLLAELDPAALSGVLKTVNGQCLVGSGDITVQAPTPGASISPGRLLACNKATARQFATVPVTTGYSEEWRTVFIQTLSNVKAGEVVSIFFENQVTTELPYNVELTHLIEVRRWVGTNPATGASYSGGTEPLEDGSTISNWHSPLTGHNISQTGVHHQDAQRMWAFVADQSYASLYICGRVRARSSAATAGAQLTIDEGQGALICQRFAPLS